MEKSKRHCSIEPKLNFNCSELNNNNNNNKIKETKMFLSNESLSSDVNYSASSRSFSTRRYSEDLKRDSLELSDYEKCERSNSCTNLIGFHSDGIEKVEVFPHIPDQFLEDMGLIGETPRIKQDEELEQKFATLSLAFSIDSTTIKDRCERQQRYRDQTEKNLAVEIERLIKRVNKLTRLCVNMETTELLATILAQIDIVVNASALASSSAERYGAVQHEEKLSQAVQLMINHVQSLKQQRDLSRKQLQYTKRVLQDSNQEIHSRDNRTQLISDEGKLIKRRASITISTLKNGERSPDKVFSRRSSDLAFRTNAVKKLSKPSRMDLGLDLVKIKEGMVQENGYNNSKTDNSNEQEVMSDIDRNENSDKNNEDESHDLECSRTKNSNYLHLFQKRVDLIYKKLCANLNLSHFSIMCSIFCFCFAVIIMVDIFLELKLSKS